MQPRKSFIRRAAISLLKKCGITDPPVDLLVVIRKCGLEYEEVDYFDDDVDALIIPFDNRVVAAVNKNSSANRRRFSLAHELCHHLYHQDRSMLIDSRSIDSPESETHSNSSKDPFESEADTFAGELLVPLPMLKKQFRPGRHTAADVARIFCVSESVASIAITSHFTALFK
jgi:Zn-dependent peptidase ImmA (M78 family)